LIGGWPVFTPHPLLQLREETLPFMAHILLPLCSHGSSLGLADVAFLRLAADAAFVLGAASVGSSSCCSRCHLCLIHC